MSITVSNTLPSTSSRLLETAESQKSKNTRQIGVQEEPRRAASAATAPRASVPRSQPGPSLSGLSALNAQMSETDAWLKEMKARAIEKSQSRRLAASFKAPQGMRIGVQSARDRQSKAPTKVEKQEEPPSTLQQRLAGHFDALNEATASFKQAFGPAASSEVPSMKAACRNLVVGQASSFGTSVVSVYNDRLEYKFSHDRHGSVSMLMWFRDIDRASLDMDSLTLSFHVCKPLNTFGADYNFSNNIDRLSLQFCSSEDALLFRKHGDFIL